MADENKKPNVVVIGGGTGSSVVLAGLRKNVDCSIFSIVPMGDSGGSSGRLREEVGVLSAGEIRQRIISLANESKAKELVKLLDHRFENGKGLKGHNFGNLLIAGLTEFHGSQRKALEVLSAMFNLKGEIVPSTWDTFELVAEYSNGKKIVGEHFIDESTEDARITSLYTQPKVKANPRAIEVIKNANVIIFGPGDLYTSILHNIVVDGIADAIQTSPAKKVFISNLMTSLGETTGMALQDMLNELENFIGGNVIDIVVINSKELPESIVKEYEDKGQFPVKPVIDEKTKKRVDVLEEDLLSREIYRNDSSDVLQRSLLRHDPDKLGSLLLNLIKGG